MTEKTLNKANEIRNKIDRLREEIHVLKSEHDNMIYETRNQPCTIVIITKAEIDYLIKVRVEKLNQLKKQLKELN